MEIIYSGGNTLISNKNIDHGNSFDWGKVSLDYAKFRDIYPDIFYEKIIKLGICVKGQKALDLGTGSGVLPRNMYKFGAEWTGIDISENQINEAFRLAKENKMKIDFFTAPAENTNLEDGYFDVIIACQCFMYFDVPKALSEINRMLKHNGRFLILFMAWLPLESEIAQKSESLVLKYNPDWTGAGYKRFEPKEPPWAKQYYDCINLVGYDTDVSFTRETWHGRMIACRGIGASSLTHDEIDRFKTEHWEYMLTLPEEFSIIHYVTMMDFKIKKEEKLYI